MNKERFLERVKDHEITVLLDTTDYKHLKFSRPDANDSHFSIMFYPGFAVFTGDMGDWVFSRVADMMGFFRGDDISPSYWSEKAKATTMFGKGDSDSPFKNFDIELFQNHILQYARNYISDRELSTLIGDRLLSTIIADVISPARGYDNEFNAFRLLTDFSYVMDDGEEFTFQDSWEWEFREFTPYFLFACYGFQWGISKYDELKKKG